MRSQINNTHPTDAAAVIDTDLRASINELQRLWSSRLEQRGTLQFPVECAQTGSDKIFSTGELR